jgi:hypothetical protein
VLRKDLPRVRPRANVRRALAIDPEDLLRALVVNTDYCSLSILTVLRKISTTYGCYRVGARHQKVVDATAHDDTTSSCISP